MTSVNLSELPKLGVGLGLNAPDGFESYLNKLNSGIDYIEITELAPWYEGKPSYKEISRKHDIRRFLTGEDYLEAGYPVVIHGSYVSPASPQEVSVDDLAFLRSRVEKLATPWVTEDLGIWRLSDRHVYPFFLPLELTQETLTNTIVNIDRFHDLVGVPFVAELPPFSFVLGDMCAFDFFSQLTKATGCGMCIDTGHLLSYQLSRGVSPMDGLHRIPWDSVVELHISGGRVDYHTDGARYIDSHGDDQIVSVCWDYLETTVSYAPNLKAVTLEVFGARKPNLALSRIDKIKSLPFIQKWLGSCEEIALVETQGQSDLLSRKTFDLLYDSECNGEKIDLPLGVVLNFFAHSVSTKLRRESASRIRYVGGTLANFYPLVISWLLYRDRHESNLALYSELILGVGGDADLSIKLVERLNAIIMRDENDDLGRELLNAEKWMNEVISTGERMLRITSKVDISAVAERLRSGAIINPDDLTYPCELIYMGSTGFYTQCKGEDAKPFVTA